MLALREEVEQEYADRMEELRNMYRVEMDSQNDKTAKERERAHAMELSLSESLKAGFIFVQHSCGFLGHYWHLEICFLSTP